MAIKQKTGIVVAALGVAAALTLSGCAGGTSTPGTSAAPGSWDAVVQAAETEGSVTYYSNDNAPVDQAIVDAFEKKYPQIKVNYTRLSDQDLAARVQQEAQAGINAADVVRSGDPTLTVSNDNNLFQTLTPDLLPSLADYPQNAYRHPWAVATAYSLYAIAYNTDEVQGADIPTTWQDVLKPEFKGEIEYSNPVGSATHMAWLDAMQKLYGDSFLQQFAQQGFTVQDGGTPGAQAVAAGSGKLALVVYAGNVTGLKSQGAPIDYVVPTPTLVKADSLTVMTKAPHPNAARVFADFRLSAEGITAMCSTTVAGSPQPNATGCASVPSDAITVKDLWTPQDSLPLITLVGLKPAS